MSDHTPSGTTDRAAILADAHWATQAALEALTNGRLELGAGLAALAARAQRAADGMPRYTPIPRTVAVPLVGATRDEQPVRPLDAFDGFGPTGNGDADLAAAAGLPVFEGVGADTVTTMPIPTNITETRPIPRTGRCHYQPPGVVDSCWAVITYNSATAKWVHAFAHPAGPYDHDALAGPEVDR